MGIYSCNNGRSLWLRLLNGVVAFAFLLAGFVWFISDAQAQTVGTVPYPNGDLSTGVEDECPLGFISNATDCQWKSAGPYINIRGGQLPTITYNEVRPSDFISNDGWKGDLFSQSVEVLPLTGDGVQVGVEFIGLGGASILEVISPYSEAAGLVTVTGTVPQTTDKVRVNFYGIKDSGSTAQFRIIELNDLVLTYTPDSSSGVGTGQATDVLYNPDLSDVVNQAQEAYTFVCDGGAETSLTGLVPDAWGGAGIGGQIAGILNQLQMICLQEASADNSVAQTDAMTNPEARSAIPSPNAYNEPEDAPLNILIEQYVAPQAGESDDLVTAANRTNDLLVANIRYQNAAMEKAFGTGEARPNYQTEGGPLMSQVDTDADSQLEFVEGDYGQTYGRVSELVDDAQLVPDAAGAIELEPLAATLATEGACMGGGVTRPPGDTVTGIQDALARIRWNAAVTMSETNMGEFLCSLATMPARTVTEFCVGSESAMVISGVAVASAEPICIFGSNAPSYLNYLMGLLPTITMLIAAVGVVKMIF